MTVAAAGAAWIDPAWLQPRPAPGDPPGVGIVGFGAIASSEHVAAYRRHGIPVVAVFDPDPAAAARAAEVGLSVAESLDALLDDDAVRLVDVATPAAVRPTIVEQALDAGRHVLAQKPFALDVSTARALVDRADAAGLVLAVNVNARWSAGWRVCSQLIAAGAIGRVRAVTHVVELDLGFQAGGPLDATANFAVLDVLTHWIDISGTWVDWSWPVRVQAEEHRLPGQPAASRSPFGATVTAVTSEGGAVVIHLIGANALAAPRWTAVVHGTDGTIRTTSTWTGPDEVELESPDGTSSSAVLGHGWVPHGFEGSIMEAVHAAATGTPAENAAESHLPMLAVSLAATESAAAGGELRLVGAP